MDRMKTGVIDSGIEKTHQHLKNANIAGRVCRPALVIFANMR
jgi:hypothetical protein